MLTENPDEGDKLGHRVQEETRIDEEGPPRVEMVGFRFVNSTWVQRVLIDETSKVLYKRNYEETKFFYVRSKVPEYMVIESKILYVYTRVPISKGQNMMMLDKYGLEWEILLPNKVKELTYLGMPIVRLDKEAWTSFDLLYKRPGPISMPSPTAPPISILRPTMSGP